MKVVALEIFNKLKPLTIHMEKFHYLLSGESDHDANTTAGYISIILQFLR